MIFEHLFKRQCPVCKEWRKKKDFNGVVCVRNQTFDVCRPCNQIIINKGLVCKSKKQMDKYWKELEDKIFSESPDEKIERILKELKAGKAKEWK